jgi:hypothetical protein
LAGFQRESDRKPGAHYFVRNDDVGPLDDELKAFAEAFMSREVPVSYQIIPARLTDVCADYLLALERARPDLVEFGQHGLCHQMTLRGRPLKREFGPERSFEQQRADIDRGLEILCERLGRERRIEIFTPPQHKFDRSTVVAAAAAGHRIFSAAAYATRRHQGAYALGRRLGLGSVLHHGISHHGGDRPEARIREISISVAVDNGRSIKCAAAALPGALEAAARRTAVVGLMFHHAVYTGAEGRTALLAAADALAQLGAERFERLGRLDAVSCAAASV